MRRCAIRPGRVIHGVGALLVVTIAVLIAVLSAGLSVSMHRAVAAAPQGSPASARRATITVSAAASLTEAFTALGAAFERRTPRATVTFNFGPSTTLATQIAGGAPVDVFAAADPASMNRLAAGGEVTATPSRFARNRMEIAVKPSNPRAVHNVADLARLDVVSLCAPSVPCGHYAARVLQRAGVTIPTSRVARTADAKAALATVARGDADAAIVYVTDVIAAGATVDPVTIPARANVTAVYPIAPIAASPNLRLAQAFVEFVVSPAGGRILSRYGFRAP